MGDCTLSSPLEPLPLTGPGQIHIKRDDLIHPQWGGNKWRKLKYHLEAYRTGSFNRMISYGGIHSNHLYALAALCHEESIPLTARIRGHPPVPLTPTIQALMQWKVNIECLGNVDYRQEKHQFSIQGSTLVIPEGGSDELAIRGIRELATEIRQSLPDVSQVFVPVGSGGTLAGLVGGFGPKIRITGIVPMKAPTLGEDLSRRFPILSERSNWHLLHDYHLGGFGKYHPEILRVMVDWQAKYGIPLDPVYTAKMALAMEDLLQQGQFDQADQVVLIHTGGLQGTEGFFNAYRHRINPATARKNDRGFRKMH